MLNTEWLLFESLTTTLGVINTSRKLGVRAGLVPVSCLLPNALVSELQNYGMSEPLEFPDTISACGRLGNWSVRGEMRLQPGRGPSEGGR